MVVCHKSGTAISSNFGLGNFPETLQFLLEFFSPNYRNEDGSESQVIEPRNFFYLKRLSFGLSTSNLSVIWRCKSYSLKQISYFQLGYCTVEKIADSARYISVV